MVGADDLTDIQTAVYESEAARVLVLGGPGSGKTQLALLMARKIVEEDRLGRRVLFLTFSRAATSELIRRAPSVLDGRLGDFIEITTFHGFAVGLLDAFRRFSGGPETPVSIATREESDLNVAAPGSIEFDALVPAVLQLFNDSPWVRDLYRGRLAAVICDEFQDTHDDWATLLEVLAEGRRLICLADPNQMIFDWIPGAASIARRLQAYRETGPDVFDLGAASHRDPTQVIPEAAAAIRDRDFDATSLHRALEARRVTVDVVTGSVRDHVVDEIRTTLASGALSIGVFFATNRQVNEFADRLGEEGLEHEVAGLSHASGEAEVATALLARFILQEVGWDDVLIRLGVFLASAWRGRPPPLATQLVAGQASLPDGTKRLLAAERDRLTMLAPLTVAEFLEESRGFWRRLVRGGGERLWAIGVGDLTSESLQLRGSPLTSAAAASLSSIAATRRATATLDNLPGVDAPIRLMNMYQVKGRQMDVSLTIREPGDHEPRTPADIRRLDRLLYVAISRARERASFVLPSGISGYFEGIAGLAD